MKQNSLGGGNGENTNFFEDMRCWNALNGVRLNFCFQMIKSKWCLNSLIHHHTLRRATSSTTTRWYRGLRKLKMLLLIYTSRPNTFIWLPGWDGLFSRKFKILSFRPNLNTQLQSLSSNNHFLLRCLLIKSNWSSIYQESGISAFNDLLQLLIVGFKMMESEL